MNEVSLDFYYGYVVKNTNRKDEYIIEDEVFKPYCIAVYFKSLELNDQLITEFPIVDDYKDVKDSYFIKEIAIDDYYQESYQIQNKRFKKLSYNYHESLTVNPEILKKENNSFAFIVCEINKGQTTGRYQLGGYGAVIIYYKYLDDNTVQLSSFEFR
jgi:hypothetical protein